VLYPTSYGRLGYVATPLMLGVWVFMAVSVQLLMAEVSAPNQNIKSVQDFGQYLGGALGRTVMSQCCLWNQQLFLPVAISLSAKALKNMVQGPAGHIIDCNLVWILMILIFFIVGVNVLRSFGHASWIARVTCTTTTLQVICIVVGLWMTARDTEETYAWPPMTLEPANAVGSRGNWADVCAAITNFAYGYCPCFVATEVMQEMSNRHEIRKALIASTIFMYILYNIAGIIPAAVVGWDIANPITDMMAHDAFGMVANFSLFFACCVDYVIASITVNQWILSKAAPDFDLEDWSARNTLRWFLTTLPSQSLAIGMVLLVPNLGTLVCILVAVVIPTAQVTCPSLLLLHGARLGLFPRPLAAYEKAMLVMACLFGVSLTMTGLSSAVVYLTQLSFAGDYFCNIVGT